MNLPDHLDAKARHIFSHFLSLEPGAAAELESYVAALGYDEAGKLSAFFRGRGELSLAQFIDSHRFGSSPAAPAPLPSPTYKVVRRFKDPAFGSVEVRWGLSLAEAREHCSGAEASSTTCELSAHRARTESYGPWLETFTLETAERAPNPRLAEALRLLLRWVESSAAPYAPSALRTETRDLLALHQEGQ